MITYKLWILRKTDVDQIDATFLIGLGCHIEVVHPEPYDFTTSNGTRWRYTAERSFIRIETTCENQEMMLQLKYGDLLELVQVSHSESEIYTQISEYENKYLAPQRRSTTR